jgi:F-type H+-transporting ATPase subunit b
MLSQLHNFGQTSTGIGALGFDAKAFLIQLVTFVIAYFVLRRYAFAPILKVLKERREAIEKGVNLGEQMQKDKADMDAKVEKALRDSRAEADEIISAAEATAKDVIRAAEDTAKEKADGILRSAEDRIVQETNQARKALEKEVINLIADTTEVVIKEKVDAKKDSQLIERALKEVQA